MRVKVGVLVAAAGLLMSLLMSGLPALAHHSGAAESTPPRSSTLKG